MPKASNSGSWAKAKASNRKPKASSVKPKATRKTPAPVVRKSRTVAPAKPVKKTDKRGTPKGKGTRPGGRGGRIGNPKFVATPEQRIKVEAFVAAGAPQAFIAEQLGISEDTLSRHFVAELKDGKTRVDWRVGGSIAQKALAGDPDMQKFYAARRAGWKTTTAVEASGPNGGPIEYRNLSDEELDARIDALTKTNVGRARAPRK